MGKDRVWLRRFGAVAVLCAWLGQAGAVEPYQEYRKHIEASQNLTALKNDLFGESVSLFNGKTDFSSTDIDLTGNNGLPVRLQRRFSAEIHVAGSGTSFNANLEGAGSWDIDVPYISGTFGPISGWATDRCSGQMFPTVSQNFSLHDIWQGNNIHVPGEGDRLLLALDTNTPRMGDGVTRRWTSSQRDMVDCIPMRSGLSGEGYRVTTTSGTRYYFDTAVSRLSGIMEKAMWDTVATVAISRVYLLASRIEDRFGNVVQYAYDGNGHPTRIWASDGREINLTYSGTQLASANADGRTWSYAYSVVEGQSRLSKVTLPDGSTWKYQYSNALMPPYTAWDGASNPTCRDQPPPVPATFVLTVTHPSGATGVFSFQNVRHYRNGIYGSECLARVKNLQYSYELKKPYFYDILSLFSKSISGPGIAGANVWRYDYERTPTTLFGSATTSLPYPCTTCPSEKQVVVTNPDGTATRYRYGNLYALNEGRLLGSSVLDASARVVSTTTNTYMTTDQAASQSFVPKFGLAYSGEDPSTTEVRPVLETALVQDGSTYRLVNGGFDGFGRATVVSRIGPTASRTDVTTYSDSISRWLLGQVGKVVNSDTGLTVSETSYDTNMMPLQTWSFGSLRQTLAYNTDGTVATVADGNGRVTTLGSWKRGIPQGITYADGTTMAAVVDAHGWITSVTDENGYATGYGYDAMGRVASIAYPGSDSVAWNATTQAFAQVAGAEYGIAAGHWRQVVATGNARKETYFDALWRPVVTREYDTANVSGTQRFQRFSYDEEGRQIFASYPGTVDGLTAGNWTEYDALGRVTSVSQDSELGLLTTTTAYLAGGQTRVTNPRGKTTLTTFQVFDQPVYQSPVSIQHPGGVYTDIARDVFGKPSLIRRRSADNALTVSRNYVYDANQRLCKTIEPETGATANGYDNQGNLVWSAAGLSLPVTTACDTSAAYASGRRVDRTYDVRNRLKTLKFPDGNGDQTWTYYSDGKPSQVVTNNDGGATQTINTYGYNKRGLLTSESTGQVGTFTWNLGYGYDANGALSTVVYPSGLSVNYAPNALGQATQAGSYATGVSYFPNGGMKQFTYGNSVVHSMTQNVRQLPVQVTDGASVLKNTYSYDEDGNVKQIVDGLDSTRTRSMVYDDLDRLTQASSASFGGDGVMKYSYDVLDNLRSARLSGIKQHNYFYDASNRLTNVQNDSGATTIGLSYDVQGNLSNKNGQVFNFDYGNRLRSASGLEVYRYDAQGRRVVSIDSAGTPIYSMYDQSGTLRRQQDVRQGKNFEYIPLNGSLVAKVITVVAPAVPVPSVPSFSDSGTYAVSWGSVASATSYQLQEQKNGGSWTGVYTGASLSWSADGKESGTYGYRLAACQSGLCSAWSASKTISVALPPTVAPTLNVPGEAYNGSVLLSWTSVTGATRYVLEERVGSGAWQEVVDGSQTSASLAGRSAGTYGYRVAAWNDGGAGPASNVADVQMYLIPTSVPVVSAPGQSPGGNFSLNWPAISAAQWYRVEESTDGQSWVVINSQLAATSLALSRGGNLSYRYRVSACNPAGCGSASAVVAVQVIITPAVAPVISLPGSSATGSYSISWSSVGAASSYQLQERVNGGAWAGLSITANLSVAVSGRADGSYAYRVQACNVAGCGPYSSEPSLAVLHPISETPAASVPAMITVLNYTLSWTSLSRASSYNIEETLPAGTISAYSGVTGTSKAFTQSAPGTWRYRVQGCNSSGCGPWSAQVSVTINLPQPPAVPTGLTVTQVNSQLCRVTWSTVSGASYYNLSQAGLVMKISGVPIYEFDGACARPYKVRACTAQGTCSAWSATK